jgi:hypothetical protein
MTGQYPFSLSRSCPNSISRFGASVAKSQVEPEKQSHDPGDATARRHAINLRATVRSKAVFAVIAGIAARGGLRLAAERRRSFYISYTVCE